MTEALVYFAQATVGGPIKTMPGGAAKERALHRQFLGARLHGEWFRATDTLARLASAIPESLTGRTAEDAIAYNRGWDAGHAAAHEKIRRLEHDVEQLTLERDMLGDLVDEHEWCPRCNSELDRAEALP